MKKNSSILIALIGVVLTALIGYYQIFHKDTITLNIERVNSTLLTKPLHTKGLKASYTYRDSIIVKKLWETTFVIRNTGKTTILGEGFPSKNIKDDCLLLRISNCEKLLSATITNCNNSARLDERKLYFTQWKEDEYVEITLITEGKKAPYLRISDRDIIDSKITYSEYSPKVVESNNKLIDSVPKGIASFFKWFYTLIVVVLLLTMPFVVTDNPKLPWGKKDEDDEDQKNNSVWEKVSIGIIMFFVVLLYFAPPLLWMF